MPTLAIVEDSPSALAQMRAALSLDAGLTLRFHAPLGQSMMEWLAANTVDLLVVDLGLPDMPGLEVIRHCRAHYPHTELLVCTLFEGDEAVFSSLSCGAGGYLLKADIATQFNAAVHQLLAGGAPMSPSIARKVLRQFQTQQDVAAPPMPMLHPASDGATSAQLGAAAEAAGFFDSSEPLASQALDEALEPSAAARRLTAKQIAILNLVARGFKYAEIGQFLGVSIHTVHSQLKAIYKKLEVNSRAEAVYEARLLQLVP